MVNWNWARGKNEPYNRAGYRNAQYAASEGELVSVTLDGNGDEQVVQADAATGEPAVGMAISEIIDPATLSSALDGLEKDLARTNDYTLIGDRVPAFKFGVEIVNDDGDTNFTEGDPVYLDEGGGYTQDPPSGNGSIRQVVARALGKDEDGRDRMMLDVRSEYKETGEAVFSGDSTGGVTQFSITHNLGKVPGDYDVLATSADAAGDYYVNATSTSLDVNYNTAPADGTDNVTLKWSVEP